MSFIVVLSLSLTVFLGFCVCQPLRPRPEGRQRREKSDRRATRKHMFAVDRRHKASLNNYKGPRLDDDISLMTCKKEYEEVHGGFQPEGWICWIARLMNVVDYDCRVNIS